MTNTPSGGASERYSYGYDTRGSISQILNESGRAKASYGYEPYGAQSAGLSKGDSDPKSPLNPYRFTGKRYDSGSGNLQMGARQFGPQTSRFLQPDRYQGALADMGLSLDPLTQNRMSLAGSNPINFGEVDGHFSLRDIGSSIKDAVTSDTAHTALDACGLVFDACDVANAASYALEGDWKNAGMSAAGAIPGIGAAATGAKLASKGADAASSAAKYSDEATDAATTAGKKGPANAKSINAGNRFHYDRLNGSDGEYGPSQIQSRYPDTEFAFPRRGQKGADVQYRGGPHPSDQSAYPGSKWPRDCDCGDFKPNTASGRRTFNRETRNGKLPRNTVPLPYDPDRLKLLDDYKFDF